MLGFLKKLFGAPAPERPPSTARAKQVARTPETGTAPAPKGQTSGRSHGHRMPIGSWAYQLQDIRCPDIAACRADLVVIDYSRDGSPAGAFKTADLDQMRASPAGGKKVVAYMSIGEAESYRFYWNRDWGRKDRRPAWLDRENPDWDENYKVRYWDPGWQRIILGTEGSYLDQIIAQGFDGVYLDIIDAFEYYEQSRPTAKADMIAFVRRVAGYARQRNPAFMVIPQNGEALLEHPEYRSAISAIAKEDLLFGLDADERPNIESEVGESLSFLELARRDGIPVLVVEYLDDRQKVASATQRLNGLGIASYYAPRDLDQMRASPTTA